MILLRLLITAKVKRLLIFLLFISSSLYSKPVLQVDIKQSNIKLSYDQAPRLSQVIMDASQYIAYAPYTLGASLIDINPDKTIDLAAKKSRLLLELEKVANSKALNLYSILKGMTLSHRVPLNLDLEAIQLNAKFNPMLKGQYTLSLPKRPDSILIIDPQSKQEIIKVKLKSGYHLNDYLKDYLRNDKTYIAITLIQADKNIITPISGYWSNNKYYLSPGAIIFVNLNNDIQSAEKINQQFIELLKYYVAY